MNRSLILIILLIATLWMPAQCQVVRLDGTKAEPPHGRLLTPSADYWGESVLTSARTQAIQALAGR